MMIYQQRNFKKGKRAFSKNTANQIISFKINFQMNWNKKYLGVHNKIE